MKQVLGFIFLSFTACMNMRETEMQTASPDSTSLATAKLDALSCSNGFIGNDSMAYVQGGGAAFDSTIVYPAVEVKVPAGMVLIPGGEFSMGGVDPTKMQGGGKEAMNDARPIHRVKVSPFLMDETEVTNDQFAAFVKATGYVTLAEKKPSRQEFPDVPEDQLVAGSIVFSPTSGKVPLDDYLQWWRYEQGADWRHPLGKGSDIKGKGNHPVVHVAWEDAAAYAKWADKRLPTEAEWEFAARGGQAGDVYAWGNTYKKEGKHMANTYQGSFPDLDAGEDGYRGIAPVKQFPPNAFGLYDVSGNVWEWCNDWYGYDYYAALAKNTITENPQGPSVANDPMEPGVPKKIHRGGSFLCTDQYCTRYMVGTRGKGDWRSPANHLGFRCVKNLK